MEAGNEAVQLVEEDAAALANALRDAEEQQPLLEVSENSLTQSVDFEDVKKRANEQPRLDDYTYVELEDLPAYMVLTSITNAAFSVLIVLGAYYFIVASGERITPHCKSHIRRDLHFWSFTEPKLKEHMCYVSTYCFWTYPLLCPLAVIWVNWKNLVDKRLFYEGLLNRIFIQQSNVSYLTSTTFWFLIIYGILAFCSILYMRIGDESSENNPYWKYKETVFSLLGYFSAIGAFLHKLFSQWSANGQIISLTNYAYRDTPASLKLLSECKFVSAHNFEVAWGRVEKLFSALKRDGKPVPVMTTPELLLVTLDMHDKWKDYKESFVAKAGLLCGMFFAPTGYWGSRLLYFPYLKDWRSFRFHFCVRFYTVFMSVSVVLFLWGFLYTTSHYLLFQYEDEMPPDLRRLPPPHEAPNVIDRARRVAPKIIDAVKERHGQGYFFGQRGAGYTP
jgi:hypothetical protein|mmetsp:Transcript_39296/g.62241  ORF Transcript_39296/g.62241 Transcript_39296/m.62241 type:complete len:448 (+) Transcript_39296:71-1414(+)|eukprot:CAMPEP_0169102322 /NCGR_PEP_ID=MMETSP1015-20121227/22103_1 /TAXON_ID=342587 /ORGANISM="Karlodinium micrum, Strain CCMP2283" /LENGTH=447 /DNA_ID=CAMNT_0009163411 /DNA_START=70 /DNA_END=1413 /DNA_ORIENTATION=-